MELGGRGVIVLDGVTIPHDLGVFEAGDHRDDGVLDVAREAGGDPVAVIFEGRAPFRLEENLVGLVGRRTGRPCPRSTGSTSARCSRSGRSTSALGGGWPG